MIEEVMIPVSEPSFKNVNKVPAKQWRRWSYEARRVFNSHFAATTDADVLTHPKMDVPKDHWETIRWNMAWLAADAVDGRM